VIDEDVIEVILHILDNWKGKLSWDTLIDAIKASISTQYTRQALSRHERIASAFSLRKNSPDRDSAQRTSGDPRIEGYVAKIATLEAENARLSSEGERYRAQFIRWTNNAQRKNLTFEDLNKPLPPVNRGKTIK
jgi:hypothetical protein